ncbi:hypothetical protein ACN47E_003102 [Coniothyrium glycines]
MPDRRMSTHRGISKADKPRSRLIERRLPLHVRNPALAKKVSEMHLTIAPILHIKTGLPAPDYPNTMLSLFLLTESQLDALAHYYSQTSPSQNTHQYPQTMNWSQPFLDRDPSLPANCRLSDLERLKIKMRMFARFIGMRGAETPVWEYERQVEILEHKIARSVREEEAWCWKGYSGLPPSARPP